MEIELARPLEPQTEYANIGEPIEATMEFAHFSNIQRCYEFIRFLKRNNISYEMTCCSGQGCLIANKTRKEVQLLVARFNSEIPMSNTDADYCKEVTDESIVMTECGVCLNDVNSIIMVNVCTLAKGHDTCITCYTHLKSSAHSCPFCRGKLK